MTERSTVLLVDMTQRSKHVDPVSDLLLPSHAAALLMVSVRTLDRYQADGRISPVYTPGGQRRFRRQDVLALLVDQSKSAS